MGAMTARAPDPADELEPHRRLCGQCNQPVLIVVHAGDVLAVEVSEWEPRAACQSCAFTRAAHPDRPVSCARCGNTGYVGLGRPAVQMVAIDVGWSDELEDGLLHIRVIGPSTDRRRGEALHQFHACPIAAL